jgi:porin
VTFDFFYVADLLSNPVGGLTQDNTGWGRIRGTIDIDFGKLTGWHGLTFHATGLWQYGVNLGANMGVIANPSGLVSAHATRLDSFWLQQSFFHDRLFLRAGQFAGLDFYGNQEYGASYIIEPLDYALGNLFPTTFESFDPRHSRSGNSGHSLAHAVRQNRGPLRQSRSLQSGHHRLQLPN